MRAATLVLSVFAAVWGAMALSAAHAPEWVFVVPALVSTVLATTIFRFCREDSRGAAERRRVGRLVALASTGEGVAILVGVNVVSSMRRPDLSATIVAVAVGLHFLPLARWIPFRIYYATAAGLLVAAMGGFAQTSALRDVVVCGGAAAVLWATVGSFLIVRRPQLALS